MTRFSHRAAKPAFTLIELLTVVAIISLLISIMLPSLGRARDQAKAVHCMARLKEFANALAAYSNVNREMLPPAQFYWVDPNPTPDDQKWPDAQAKPIHGWAEILGSPPEKLVSRRQERQWTPAFLRVNMRFVRTDVLPSKEMPGVHQEYSSLFPLVSSEGDPSQRRPGFQDGPGAAGAG